MNQNNWARFSTGIDALSDGSSKIRMMPFGITFTFVSRMHEATAASAIVSPGAAFPAGIHQRHDP